MAIDATSCLIHNRRDGLAQVHDNENDEQRPKSFCFTNSLETASRWTSQLNDLEMFDFPRHIPRTGTLNREYPIFIRPQQRNSDNQNRMCEDCLSGSPCAASICEFYGQGKCWYFYRMTQILMQDLRIGPL